MRIRSIASVISFAVFFLFFAGISHAATITGEVYDYKLNKLDNVIVFVNSEPVQRYILKNHTYLFELPPGTYTLTARTFDDEEVIFGTDEQIVVRDEGLFIFDLILEPVEPGDTFIISGKGAQKGIDYHKILRYTDFFGLVVLILFSLFLLWHYVIKKRINKNKQKYNSGKSTKGADISGNSEFSVLDSPDVSYSEAGVSVSDVSNEGFSDVAVSSSADFSLADEKHFHKTDAGKDNNINDNNNDSKDDNLNDNTGDKKEQDNIFSDDSAKKIFFIIKKEKRITQKDIRKQIPDSEAKVSLVLAEFESKGMIKKIKKGRGNIIIFIRK